MPLSLVSEIRGSKASLPTPPCARVSIRRITAKGHPAIGQNGLFAARNITADSHICDYLGEVHCEDRNSDYDLSLFRSREGISVGVDASQMGNESRFVNDYRGVKARPNAIFKETRTPSGELRISIWSATSKIRKGEEILVSYGKSWWRARITGPGTYHDSKIEVRDFLQVFRNFRLNVGQDDPGAEGTV